jgi:hypothetical protein
MNLNGARPNPFVPSQYFGIIPGLSFRTLKLATSGFTLENILEQSFWWPVTFLTHPDGFLGT